MKKQYENLTICQVGAADAVGMAHAAFGRLFRTEQDAAAAPWSWLSFFAVTASSADTLMPSGVSRGSSA